MVERGAPISTMGVRCIVVGMLVSAAGAFVIPKGTDTQDPMPDKILAAFDATIGATFDWRDMNDPVMGGRTTSTFNVKDGVGVFHGHCAIVPSLKAPGFAKVGTTSGLFRPAKFADVSSEIDGGIALYARTTTPKYGGFRVAFSATGIPRTSPYGGGSFKSGFTMQDTTDWQVVHVPFSDFSYDWSGFTGRCDTTDPSGQQHHCCGDGANAKYCPTSAFLAAITGLELWAEGVEGDFHLEVKWIGASDQGASKQKNVVVPSSPPTRSTSVSTEAFSCPELFQGVFADMHDGDQKVVELLDRKLTIRPYSAIPSWEVVSDWDAKTCSASIDFNVPGKPSPPPVNLQATLAVVTTAAKTEASMIFTDPTGKLADKDYPLNAWLQMEQAEAPAAPQKGGCDVYHKVSTGECAEGCIATSVGFCPRSLIVKMGGLDSGGCADMGYTVAHGSQDESAGPCGTLTFNIFDKP